MKVFQYAAFICLAAFCSCANNKTEEPKPEPVVECVPGEYSFATNVKPIIETKCATSSGCHATGSFTGDFTNFQELKEKVTNGKFKNSVLDHKAPVMPPMGSAELTEAELKILKCWHNNGAPNN